MPDLVLEFSKLDSNLRVAIISAATSILIFVLGTVAKVFHDAYSLRYKLKKEYHFDQMKKIKEEILKNKSPLLISGEELNYRLWNLRSNISETWHNVPEKHWKNSGNYYLLSFVYRLLVFLNLILKTEKSIISFDSVIASKEDKLYLKFVKTFKNLFTDLMMLKEFGYGGEPARNHFFKDNIEGYSAFVQDSEGKTISFNEFKNKVQKDYTPIHEVIRYISEIYETESNINYNVMKGFHLILISFLNLHGHDYQKTSLLKKARLITSPGMAIYNKRGFLDYLKRSKIKSTFLVESLMIRRRERRTKFST